MKRIAMLLLVAMSCASCSSYLTKNGRQQAAYERYVRRSSHGRAKLQQRIVASQKPPAASVSEPVISTSTGPESMTEGSAEAQ